MTFSFIIIINANQQYKLDNWGDICLIFVFKLVGLHLLLPMLNKQAKTNTIKHTQS